MSPQVTSHQPDSPPEWEQDLFTTRPNPSYYTHGVRNDKSALNGSASTSAYPVSGDDDAAQADGLFDSHNLFSFQDVAKLEHAKTLHPPTAAADGASPAFSFDDYLTPEFSEQADFEASSHATPNAVEAWEQENLKNPYVLSHSGDPFPLSNTFNGLDQTHLLTNNLQPGTLHHTALLTPELSTASLTPERSSHYDHVPLLGPSVGRPEWRQSREPNSDAQMAPRSGHSPSGRSKREADGTDRAAVAPPISPIVMVSSYNRGDSPARPQVPLSRSASKRSHSSRLGEHLESAGEDRAGNLQSSRLMPPTNDPWGAGEEDNEDDEAEEASRQIESRSGVAPGVRHDDLVASLNDLEKQKELNTTIGNVEHWLATSEAGSPTGLSPDQPWGKRPDKNRLRSRSTGAKLDAMGLPIFPDRVPGPGRLLDVESEIEDDSDDHSSAASEGHESNSSPESPPAHVDTSVPQQSESYFPPVEDDNVAPDEILPLPRQFYRQRVWQDPVIGQDISKERTQPGTSNAAIYQWEKATMRFETASRAATWGTRRRLSDSDMASVLDGSHMTRHLSLIDKARARKASFMNSAKNMIPRRSSSFIKKHHKASSRNPSPEAEAELERVHSPQEQESRPSMSPFGHSRRRSSFTKHNTPKSPTISTGGALMAMTGQLTAVGGSSVNVVSEQEPLKSPLLGALKRMRSRSDVTKSPKPHSGGLSDLFTRHGGPPVAVLASSIPQQPKEAPHPAPPAAHEDDMDDDDGDGETPIKMEMPITNMNILPTLEGFKTHARQLNPRLEPYLIDRIAHDQLKRYKKLVKNKVDHSKQVQLQQCSSGPAFCEQLGGKPHILPPRTSAKESGTNHAQFKVTNNNNDSENEDAPGAAFVEGVVTPALFPAGIPLPPVTVLPAEFECFLCFQVKKFQKPSDWTKHVHEDVQPFSCTFPNCSEPKSFKRKADWVRHENERHRHLEWWKCSVQECNHVCYRKDNFVQHLVREHKMTEPKAKGQKSGTRARSTSRNAAASALGQGDFWQLVDSCRHVNEAQARSEPCKFCNNVCSTWKKLSVHVGKHMEQLALPTIQLAKIQKVGPETIVSPVEPLPQQNYINTALDAAALNAPDRFSRSPYTASAHSYQNSSTGHSPALMHAHTQSVPAVALNQPYYNLNSNHTVMQPIAVTNAGFGASHAMAPQYPYDAYGQVDNTEFMAAQHPSGVYNQTAVNPAMHSQFPQQNVPRSQALEGPYNLASMQGTGYEQTDFYGGVGVGMGDDAAYMPGYGHAMGHSHDGMITGTSSGHAGHPAPRVDTPGSTGHSAANVPYYTSSQAGPSGQGYQPY